MDQTPTEIQFATVDENKGLTLFELVRTEMFPEHRKLADARQVCKFFEYLEHQQIFVCALDANNNPVDLLPWLSKFLGFNRERFEQESKELGALIAEKTGAITVALDATPSDKSSGEKRTSH